MAKKHLGRNNATTYTAQFIPTTTTNIIMNLKACSREQHFYVVIAKHVFLHTDKGIVFVRDPIRLEYAEKLNLKPLLLYGLTVPGTQIRWHTFSLFDEPRSLISVLLDGWKNASGLRGYPDKLKINRYIANACPHLQSSLSNIGDISLVVADGKDMQFHFSLREGQHGVIELGLRNRNWHVIYDVKELNDYALNAHNEHINRRIWEVESTKFVKKQASEWMGLPVNVSNAALGFSQLDWIGGPWLSTWELKLSQNQKIHVLRKGMYTGCYWLVSEEDENREDTTVEDWGRCCGIKAKILVDCWPNKPCDIAKAIGIKTIQLHWFLKNRAMLSETKKNDLSELLGIEASTYFVDYDITGPCVLIAGDPEKCSAAYDELSNGGDINYSVEVIPERGTLDPSWRYVVFAAYGQLPNIFMFQRGSKTAGQLGNKLLMNYQGEREVPAAIYWDVVSICVQCCTDPLVNRKLMIEFGKRHDQYFGEIGTEFRTWR